jgi:DNA-binding helix-hairpin-helix protein with protein kinase domain
MPRLAFPTQLRDHLGNEVRLPPKPFAVGGEGAVFDVQGRPDLVAKLYNKPQSKERCDKLRAMAKLCSPELLKIAAWPTATLSAGNGAAIDGILMPRITGYLEIHHLYSVAQRKKDFPEADWGFLLHTARNCAIAFEAVHAHGHVVGDVNQKNVMVSKKGLVAFVDCDSFQVAEGSRIFRCGVGVPEYTPPELHGKNFATLDRAVNHDLFGLAVLIFHLLMMGRHPFSGVPLAQADIPIEKAIQDGCYAYTRNAARARLRPPPHVPPAAMLDPVVLDLFDRAFCTPRRPTATEWRTSLDAAMKQLFRCKNDPKHAYLPAAGNCPWCVLIAVERLMFFLPSQGTAAAAFRPEDIPLLIRKLFGMVLTFGSYARPRPLSPVVASLPSGLRSVMKPVPASYPTPPPVVQKPALTPLPLAPPLAPKPSLLPLSPQPQPVRKPPLTPHPAAPHVQRPALAPHPPAPPDPPLPKFKPLPAAPHVQRPALAPEPLAPPDPLLPKLKPLPAAPAHPEPPQLGPPDPFLSRVCIVGIAAGFLVLFIARPVGFVMIACFAVWWLIMVTTENQRREMARRAMRTAHQIECDRIEEEYAELCRPIEEANRRRMAAWQAAKAALDEEHARACKKVDDRNARQLSAFEAAEAAARAEHDRGCKEIEAQIHRLIAAWEATNAAQTAEYERERNDIDAKNRVALTGWEAENSRRQADYQQTCKEIEAQNRRLIAAWEATNAARQSEHERARRKIDEENQRAIGAWKVANAPWFEEEKRWRQRLADAEADLNRLESELYAQRSASQEVFGRRGKDVEETVSTHAKVKREYDGELRQAETNSMQIQLEEYLDKELIRNAKIKGISSKSILAMESFGIETAKDVEMLKSQKVPGIGPVLSGRLFDWRWRIERTFIPKQALPESERSRIVSRYAPVFLPLGQTIQTAIRDLDVIAASHWARERELIRAIEAVVQTAAIAEAHLDALKKLL